MDSTENVKNMNACFEHNISLLNIYLVVELNEVSSFTVDIWTVLSAAGSRSWSTSWRGCRRYSACTPHWARSCTTAALNWAGWSTTTGLTFDTCCQETTFSFTIFSQSLSERKRWRGTWNWNYRWRVVDNFFTGLVERATTGLHTKITSQKVMQQQ